MSNDSFDFQTFCAHAGADTETFNAPFVPPIVQSTVFRLGTTADAENLFAGHTSGYIYSRFGNPTIDRLAEVLARLEGGAGALVTASGNAATLCAILMSVHEPNDRIAALQDLYGGSLEVLHILSERFGLQVDIIDPTDEPAWERAIRHAKVVFVETPTNPLLHLVDIRRTAALAAQVGATLIVDNTVATPYNQLPLSLGANIVVHSLSKYLNGHSDVIGGCIVTKQPITIQQRSFHKNLGGTVNPFDAWLTLRGLRTFALRMQAHNQNALAIAQHLAYHPAVRQVHFPALPSHPQHALYRQQMRGPGALLAFEPKGGAVAAERFLDRMRLIVHAVSLGGMESLATRPAATSHRGVPPALREKAGISDALIRLSVGTEALGDLIADIDRALAN